jgi:hypothetical protein
MTDSNIKRGGVELTALFANSAVTPLWRPDVRFHDLTDFNVIIEVSFSRKLVKTNGELLDYQNQFQECCFLVSSYGGHSYAA